MKRIYVLTREFSWDNVNYVPNGYMEVFTTLKRALDYISSTRIRNTIESEDNGGSEYCYRIIIKTDSGSYIRWTVIGRNLNANY